MYKHLLIATDGSDLASKAASQGFDLAKALGAKVTIVTVSEPAGQFVSAEIEMALLDEKACEDNAKKVLSQATASAKAQALMYDAVYVRLRQAADGIIETAANRGCDLIVMGSHGYKGLKRLLLGSQAHRVITESSVSVLICR
jgi:nucleotide-binding universal stress UspA family protein